MRRNFTFFSCLLLMALFLSGCMQPSSTDLNNMLNPAALPYLKQSKLMRVSSYDTAWENSDRMTIPAGKTIKIMDVQGPGVISRLWFDVQTADKDYLRRLVIRMYWDNEEQPSVEVPFGDFFGSGFEYRPYSTPFMSVVGGSYASNFPMPFEDRARIEIVNESDFDVVSISYQVDYQKVDGYLSRDIAYFHAYWHRDIRTDYDSSYVILRTRGHGHVVGVNLNIQSYNKKLDFLGGIERIYIDGEKKPSIAGTGTGNFFSAGSLQHTEFVSPYSGIILRDDSAGRISGYRFFIQDAISFKKSIKFTMEHGSRNQDLTDFSSTVFWYQTEPHHPFPPMPKAGQRIPLRAITPGKLLEAENLNIKSVNVKTRLMDMSNNGPEWSGEKQVLFETRKGSQISIVLPRLEETSYDIEIYYTKGPNYGDASVYLGEQKIGEIHAFASTVLPGGKVTLKGLQNEIRSMELKIIVDGKDSLSTGYYLGLDGLNLLPKRTFIPDWYVTGSFPFPVKNSGSRSALDSVYPPEYIVDLKKTSPGVKSKPIGWHYLKTGPEGYVSLNLSGQSNRQVVNYAVSYIYSPVRRNFSLFIGSDDGIKIFFNNKQVFRFLGTRLAQPDQGKVILPLHPGWNKLLIKVENKSGVSGFFARILDKEGILQYSADQKLP